MASHYINNEDFLNAFIEYKKNKAANPDTLIPDYIGLCIMEIAKRFSRRPNFINYSYRDEMVSDAIENCLLYIDNFDPEKSKNPFAYFTQICYFAFIRRISSEKKQSYIKHKLIQDMPLEAFEMSEFDDHELSQSFVSFVQSHNEFDASLFENKLKKKKEKSKDKTNLEFLMEDSEE